MSTVQLMLFGLILSAFALFMITLFAVSLYVSAGQRDNEAKIARVVTPARRAE